VGILENAQGRRESVTEAVPTSPGVRLGRQACGV
jgi:hypothetical protein